MKKIFSILITCISIFGLSLVFAGCTPEEFEINDEMTLGRCLVPTDLAAKVNQEDGQTVAFSWTKTKGSVQFVLEVYTDEAMTQQVGESHIVGLNDLPYNISLEADVSYYARVKGQSGNETMEDSKWASFKKFETFTVKPLLPGVSVSAKDNTSVTLAWTYDQAEASAPEIDHIRVIPALNEADKEQGYTRLDVSSEQALAALYTVSGLEASHNYNIAVHYRGANRGALNVWTRPNTDGVTIVRDTAQFKAAFKEATGLVKIQIPYADTAYVIGNVNVSQPFEVYGETSVDGDLPTLVGGFNIKSGVTSIHLEGITMSGMLGREAYAYQIMLNIADSGVALSDVVLKNIESNYYYKSFIYANKDSFSIENFVLDGVWANDYSDGQDFIDVRKGTVTETTITNSTFSSISRTLVRYDANVVASNVNVSNSTFSKVAFADHKDTKGIFAVRAAGSTVNVSSCLFLNMHHQPAKCFMVYNHKDAVIPSLSDCFYYKPGVTEEVEESGKKVTKWSFMKTNAGYLDGPKSDELLGGDPCYNSEKNIFNLTNAEVLAAKAGDPRWHVAYVEAVENLDWITVVPVKTWDFTDSRTFTVDVEKNMVRDGIRFYVKGTPIVVDGGVEFQAAGKVDMDGVPTESGIGFEVDCPGAVVLSVEASAAGTDFNHLNISLDGKIVEAVPVGATNKKVSFPDIEDGTKHYIYLYGCGPVVLKKLQWTDDIEVGADPVLATPVVTIDNASVTSGTSKTITLSWNDVAKAGSYEVVIGNDKYTVTGTSYSFDSGSLADGIYKITVQAIPKSDDLIREPSLLSEITTFEVLEVLKPVLTETVWGGEDFKWMCENKAENNKENFTPSWTSYVHNNLEYYANNSIRFKDSESLWYFQYPGSSLSSGSVTRRYLKFIAAGPGTLSVKIDATATGRKLHVQINDVEIGSGIEAPVENPTEFTWDVNVENESPVIIYADGSLRVYSIKWTPTQVAATQEYTMTLSATAGVHSANITGIPSSWKDATWTAKDDSGKDEITFTGNVYYSTSDSKNIVWYFNKNNAETHVTAAGLGKVKRVIIYPNSSRKPKYLTCSYGDNKTLAATEDADTNSATITFDFAAAGIDSDTFRIDYSKEVGTNVEVGKVEIIYEK